jgi:hypothetical protein
VLSTACKQDETVAAIKALTTIVSRSGLGFNNAKMQIDYYGTTEPEEYELTRETLLAMGSANVARGKL